MCFRQLRVSSSFHSFPGEQFPRRLLPDEPIRFPVAGADDELAVGSEEQSPPLFLKPDLGRAFEGGGIKTPGNFGGGGGGDFVLVGAMALDLNSPE